MAINKLQRSEQMCIAGLLTLMISLALILPTAIAQSVSDLEIQQLRLAQTKVDEAWEIFHEAALGGTLASPRLQTEIETDLHDLRGLLAQSWGALAAGDKTTARTLINQIERLTNQVAGKSRTRKD